MTISKIQGRQVNINSTYGTLGTSKGGSGLTHDDWLVKESSYTVFLDGATWKAVNGTTGDVDSSNADFATVLNVALAALTAGRTWKEKVKVRGNASVSTTILVPSYTILDLTEAILTLANGVNAPMIQNTAGAGGDCEIGFIGGLLDGNGDNQTAGGTISLKGVAPFGFSFKNDMEIQYGYDYNLFLNACEKTKIVSIRCRGRGGSTYNARFYQGSDTLVTNSFFSAGSKYTMTIDGQTGTVFANCYFGGCTDYNVYILSSALPVGILGFSNCINDAANKHGWYISGVTLPMTITGGTCTPWTDITDNTYSAFYLTGSSRVTIKDVGVKGFDSHRWKCGVEEAGGSDNNHYNISVGQYVVSSYTVVGASTVMGTDHTDVTLSAELDAILSLSTTQGLDLDTQAANTVPAGPTAGPAAKPTYRALVAADMKEYHRRIYSDIAGVITTQVGTAGRVFLGPLQVFRTITFDRIGFIVTTQGGVGTTARLGIYGSTSDAPDTAAVVVDGGTVDVTTVGPKEVTVDVTLAPGLYFICLEAEDAVIVFRNIAITAASEKYFGCRYDRGGGYGALTDPCPVTTINSLWPYMWVRVSA